MWISLIVESQTEVNLSDFRESNFGVSLWFYRVKFRSISLILESQILVDLSDFRESILGDSLLF